MKLLTKKSSSIGKHLRIIHQQKQEKKNGKIKKLLADLNLNTHGLKLKTADCIFFF